MYFRAEAIQDPGPDRRRHVRPRLPRREFGHAREGGDQDDEAEVPQLGRSDGPARGQVPQEAPPPQRRQAEGGPLLIKQSYLFKFFSYLQP